MLAPVPHDPFNGLPHGHYACIVADAAWDFKVRSAKGADRSPDYQTMDLRDIQALPVVDLAARNSHLFFWITGPMLVQGAHIPIMRAWGYEPTAIAFTWVKTRKHENAALFLCPDSFHVGLGYTTRKNAEFCILGRRGAPKRLSKSVRELIIAPRREHSRKPDEFYDRVRAYCSGPYLELFSRQIRPAFDAWGNQVGMFGAAA